MGEENPVKVNNLVCVEITQVLWKPYTHVFDLYIILK